MWDILLCEEERMGTYFVGVARGLDVDQSRNLAKSVTVE